MFESLEARRLMSIVLEPSGVLEITGTSGSDAVSTALELVGGTVKVDVTLNGHLQQFLSSSIHGVEIHLGAGADVCHLATDPPTTVFGGAGADLITDDSAGGDVLWGGAGNDTLQVTNGGNDLVHGGAGSDVITGPPSAQPVPVAGVFQSDVFIPALPCTLIGGAGDDSITAGNGGDMIFGDAGNDVLIGGPGSDSIFGGAGNDTLAGNRSILPILRVPPDQLVGGAGNNVVSNSLMPSRFELTTTISTLDH